MTRGTDNMNIAFDIDGVFTDFEKFLNIFGTKYMSNKVILKKYPVEYSPSFAKRYGCSKEQEKKFYGRYLLWYSKNFPMRENVAGVIHQLRKQGHKIYIITGRALSNENNALGTIMRRTVKRWLRTNRIEYDGIYFVSTENSSTEKRAICKKLHIDYMVEDDPENIERISSVSNIICLDADYNRELNVKHARAYDFNDIFTIIQSEDRQQLLSGMELDNMPPDKKKTYIRKMQQYYRSLPFDKGFVHQYKSSQRKSVFFLGWLVDFMHRIKISGIENIPQDRNVIFVCNHRRSFDIPLLYFALKSRRPRLLVKEECEFSGYGEIIRKLGIIFVKRENKISRKKANSTMIHNVLRGQDVLIFPEGTRNKTNATLLPFKRGAVLIAQMTGKPIVPIVINKNGWKYNVTIARPESVGVEDSTEQKTEFVRKRMECIYNIKRGC